jgi:hypothetical protein
MTKDESPIGPLADKRPTWVFLGNRAAIDTMVDEKKLAKLTPEQVAEQGIPRKIVPIPVPKACTRVEIEPGLRLLDAAATITGPDRIWARCSSDPAPAWVASSDPMLAQVLAEHYGCELREVELDHGDYTVDDKAAAKLAAGAEG